MTFSVYVAGPLFSEAERSFLEKTINDLVDIIGLFSDIEFMLPHRVCSNAEHIFDCDMTYLAAADMVLAWLDGSDIDSGTAFEIGYAYSKGKAIAGYITDKRFNGENINKMIYGACNNGGLIFDSIKDLADAVVRAYDVLNENDKSNTG